MDQEKHNALDMVGRLHYKKIHGMIVVILIFLSVFLAAKIITEVREWKYVGSGITPTNTITIQGEGEVFAVPDVATFTFSVIKKGKTAGDAQNDAAEVVNSVIDFLKENGIDERNIKTTNYNVYPRYEYEQIVCVTYPCSQGERKLVGYEINQSVQVKVHDTKEAGRLLSGVGGFDVDRISGLSFTIDDEDKLKREARQSAILDARDKAKELADDLNVRLVRVVNFTEYNSPAYARFEESAFNFAGDDRTVPEIPIGENRITSQVNITYEIR